MKNRFRNASALGRRLSELGISPVGVPRRAGLHISLFDQSRVWEWLKVRAEFEAKYGKIVDKVESQFVSPVDFSPLK